MDSNESDFWAQFITECREHMEITEDLLIQADTDSLSSDEINTLFRSVHSVKGLAKVMDLNGMESVAHHAEDILGVIRDGELELKSDIISLLLEVVDELKDHMAYAGDNHSGKEANRELLTALEQYLLKHMDKSQPLHVDTVNTEDEMDDGTKYQDSTLHEDPDMLLFFSELLSTNIPELAKFTSFKENKLSKKEAKEILSVLSHASETMGFDTLAKQIDTIDSFVQGSMAKKIRQNDINECLKTINSFLNIFQEDTGLDGGFTELNTALKRVVGERCIDKLSIFTNYIQEINNLVATGGTPVEGNSESNVVVDKIKALLKKSHESIEFICQEIKTIKCNEQIVHYVYMLDDLLTTAHQITWNQPSDFIDLLSKAATQLNNIFHEFTEGKSISLSLEECEASTQNLWHAVNTLDITECDHEVQTFDELSKIIDLNPEFEESLNNEHLRQLNDWVSQGRPVYEASVYLEKSETFTASFLECFESRIEILTNSNITVNNELRCDILFLATMTESELRTITERIDPTREYLKFKLCQYRTPKVENKPQAADAKEDTAMLRVPGVALDHFMRYIGEMVSIRGMLNHSLHAEGFLSSIKIIRQRLLGSFTGSNTDVEILNQQLDMLEKQYSQLDQIDRKMHGVLSRMQDSVLALRVVPVETVFRRFLRIVRDLSSSQGKKVKLEMKGQDVKIDKSMAEILYDPLMHMVRNSIDHGIELPVDRITAHKPENGTIVFSAMQRGSSVYIEVYDDGRGINQQAIRKKAIDKGLVTAEQLNKMDDKEIMQFIFSPGFSTAANITQTSGRGVGMDVVISNVTRVGGSVGIDSEPGRGVKFTIELPLSTAIQDTLLVGIDGQVMAIPERYVDEMIDINKSELQPVKGCHAVMLRDSFLPVYPLGSLLGFHNVNYDEKDFAVVVLSDDKQRIGVIVDRSYQRQDLFVKEIHQQLTELPGVNAAAILGDGSVVLILDVEDIFDIAVKKGGSTLVQGVFGSVA